MLSQSKHDRDQQVFSSQRHALLHHTLTGLCLKATPGHAGSVEHNTGGFTYDLRYYNAKNG